MANRDLPTGIYQLPSGAYRAMASVYGTKVFEVFETIAEAKAWREVSQAAVKRGEPIPSPARDRMTQLNRYMVFKEAADAWHENHVRTSTRVLTPRTILLHRQALANHHFPYFEGMRLNEIDLATVEGFRDHLVDLEIGFEWQKKMLWIARSVLEYARGRGWIDSNPAASVRAVVPRVPGVRKGKIPFIVLSSALAIASILNPCYRVAMWLQRLCGLRISEVFGLHIADWDNDLRILHVQRQGGRPFSEWDADGEARWRLEVSRTKTAAGDRLIGVPKMLADLLDDHIAVNRTHALPSDPLIVGPQGGRNSTSYGQALKRAAAELNIADSAGNAATTHDLRKSFNAQLDIVKARYHIMSYLMGHKGGAFEGAAAITEGIYNTRTPLIMEIVALADSFDACMRDDGITSLDVSILDSPTGDWFTIVQASAMLDVCDRTVRDYAKAGKLRLTSFRTPGVKYASTYVLRAEVEALVERRANRVSIREAASALGIDDGSVVRAAGKLGIPVTHGIDGTDRGWFSIEGYDGLAKALGTSRWFTDRHLPLIQAARRLEVKSETVRKLISRKLLAVVEPPRYLFGIGAAAAVWVKRTDVEKLLRTKALWYRGRKRELEPPTGLLTTTQAAALMKVSENTVRKLFAAGGIGGSGEPSPGRRRIWIDADSAERFDRERQDAWKRRFAS